MYRGCKQFWIFLNNCLPTLIPAVASPTQLIKLSQACSVRHAKLRKLSDSSDVSERVLNGVRITYARFSHLLFLRLIHVYEDRGVP